MTASPQADNLPLPPLPTDEEGKAKRFGLVSIDPPWHFRSRAPVSNPDSDRSPQAHYPTMDLDHIAAIPMKQIAKPDAYVMLWITGPLMVAGVHNKLFKAWGCRPSSTAFVWIKLWNNFDTNDLLKTPLLEADLAMGTGFTTRQNAEFVMLARFGSPKIARRDIRQVIVSPRREHSRKPEEFYRRCEYFCEGPRIDMFAGAQRPGWTSYGWSHREGERSETTVQHAREHGTGLAHEFEAGHVAPDGSIWLTAESRARTGTVQIPLEQLELARRYGWAEVGSRTPGYVHVTKS